MKLLSPPPPLLLQFRPSTLSMEEDAALVGWRGASFLASYFSNI